METTVVIPKVKWEVDTVHSEVSFKVKHLMITNVRGLFKVFGASIYTTGEDFLTTEIEFWINPSSISTGDEKRDEHLKSADFFNVAKYKQISFSGNTFEKTGKKGEFILHGELTMKGITKQIKLDVQFNGLIKDSAGNQKAGFTIKGLINRNDWGLNWNSPMDTGGMLVSEEVKINCEVPLIKQS